MRRHPDAEFEIGTVISILEASPSHFWDESYGLALPPHHIMETSSGRPSNTYAGETDSEIL